MMHSTNLQLICCPAMKPYTPETLHHSIPSVQQTARIKYFVGVRYFSKGVQDFKITVISLKSMISLVIS